MFLEQLIRKRLKELHPGFDYTGIESKMYTIAVEDFKNYFAVKWQLSVQDAIIKFQDDLVERGMTVKDETDAWVSMWLVMWKKRVKLILTEEAFDRHKKGVQALIRRNGSKRKYRKIGPQRIKQFKWPVIECLVNNGELCFTDLLAEQIIKQRLRVYTKSLNTSEGILNALYFIMKRVGGLSGTSGPLVFIKVNKGLFG